MNITEERLKELEELGREAIPMKAELKLLCATYREVLSGLKLINDNDGRWLHFSTTTGKKALVNIDVMAAERGDIVGTTILEWAKDQSKAA